MPTVGLDALGKTKASTLDGLAPLMCSLVTTSTELSWPPWHKKYGSVKLLKIEFNLSNIHKLSPYLAVSTLNLHQLRPAAI